MTRARSAHDRLVEDILSDLARRSAWHTCGSCVDCLTSTSGPSPDILIHHGVLGAAIWLAYWTLSARVKVAFGPHVRTAPVSFAVLGAVMALATLLVLLVIGAASLG